MSADISNHIEQSYREDWGPSVAYMLKISGELEAAEECVQSAFESALKSWPKSVPENKGAWIRKAAKNRFIDSIRAAKSRQAVETSLKRLETQEASQSDDEKSVLDDELILIFLCCHPAINPTDQVMLVLRLIGGLKPAEIAHAFVLNEEAVRSRLLRAKRKMRAAKISTSMPAQSELPSRLSQVLAAIYLIYNEGYRASRNAAKERVDLVLEAIRLSGRLCLMRADDAEVHGLMALILLSEARRPARFDGAKLVPLEDQIRSKWDQDLIKLGELHLKKAGELCSEECKGIYQCQAEISFQHCKATLFEQTDWQKIVEIYDELCALQFNPLIEINRLAALSFIKMGPDIFVELDQWEADNGITSNSLAIRADVLRREGDKLSAFKAYKAALKLEKDPAVAEFLKARLSQVSH